MHGRNKSGPWDYVKYAKEAASSIRIILSAGFVFVTGTIFLMVSVFVCGVIGLILILAHMPIRLVGKDFLHGSKEKDTANGFGTKKTKKTKDNRTKPISNVTKS